MPTTWTAASSPYTLTRSVLAEEKATLTIQSGVTVNNGQHEVRGTIAPLDAVTFNGGGIYLKNVNGYSIKNCVFNGRGYRGIELQGCNNCITSNNVVENYHGGIYLLDSGGSILSGNTANNGGTGIWLSGWGSSNNNTFTGNTANNNKGDGIQLVWADNSTLSSNTANYNRRSGIYLHASSNSTLSSNTANYNDPYGIKLDISNSKFTDNTANNNGGGGIYMSFSENNTLTSNTVNDNDGYGISMGGSRNTLTSNTVNNNSGDGIDYSSRNGTLTDNIVNNNKGNGISLKYYDLVIKGTGNEITGNGGNGIFADRGDVTIEGTTEIHDNGGWGIRVEEGTIEIHDGAMSSINRNGKGGILTRAGMTFGGVKLPANFVVDDNGGHGIFACCGVDGGVVTDTLILESVKVRNNKGDGIVVVEGNLLIKGTGNEITNNGGNGTRVFEGGDVTIKGTTEIHDNGGWGIYTDGGNVDVHDGSMSSINRNGKGGILTLGGVKLPANFVVDDNGGPGIVGGGGIVGGVVTETLILESVKVRNNKDDGICVVDAHLVIKGTGSKSTNNGGCGIHVDTGKVNIRDAKIINNANGGIRLFSSDHGTLTGNTVSNNGEYGISLFTSNDNTIYNNIFDNPKNTVDDGTNTWNIAKTAGTNIVGGPYLGGNYWSDYE